MNTSSSRSSSRTTHSLDPRSTVNHTVTPSSHEHERLSRENHRPQYSICFLPWFGKGDKVTAFCYGSLIVECPLLSLKSKSGSYRGCLVCLLMMMMTTRHRCTVRHYKHKKTSLYPSSGRSSVKGESTCSSKRDGCMIDWLVDKVALSHRRRCIE